MEAKELELEPSDYPQGWYHVRVDYAVGHKPAVVDVAKLAQLLPHGSGIDSDWYVRVMRSGDVLVVGSYHAMNDAGYYDGWRGFRFSLKRCTRNEYTALRCEGKYQVTRIKGHVYFQSFVGGGDARDYLYDTCYWPMSDGLGVPSIVSIQVDSEQAAKDYR